MLELYDQLVTEQRFGDLKERAVLLEVHVCRSDLG